MTAAQQLNTSGFAALLSIGGEPLTYNKNDGQTPSASVTGLVNRDVVKGKDFLRSFNNQAATFDMTGLTVVEVAKTDFATAPVSGENFVDSTNYRHRVRLVTQTDTTYCCFCTPSSKS